MSVIKPQPTAATAIDVEGSEAVSNVLLDLLNQFPGLKRERITFSTLGDTSGIGFFPTSGAALLSDNEDVTGHVTQVCLYPFNIIYRAAPNSEAQRLRIKEFLDGLGRWLERQPVQIGDVHYRLTSYPELAVGNREIKAISRSNPGHLNAVYQDGIEDWMISATLKYENNYDK